MSLSALPNRRVEAWKYTDLAAAHPDMRLPEGDGPVIARLAGAVGETIVPPGATEVVVERLGGPAFEARASRVVVSEGATFVRVLVQPASDGTTLSHVSVELAAGASFRQFIYTEGARLARHETDVAVCGEGADVRLNGLWLAGPGMHVDLTSTVRHHVGHGVTSQLVKGAARARGRGVFQGKILVARGAQKTDARQSHKALLLEDGAEVFAKPELEIHADDVQCAHGATVGGLDAMTLFYMRSRGLPLPQARAMLVEAFVAEAAPDGLPDGLGEEVQERLRTWLGEVT